MRLDDLLGDGQPQAGARLPGRALDPLPGEPRPMKHRVRPMKHRVRPMPHEAWGLEQVVELIGGDARPVVGDRELGIVPLPGQVQLDLSAGIGELDRIGEQVVQHLLDPRSVEQHVGDRPVAAVGQADVLSFGQRPVHGHVPLHERRQVGRLPVQGQASRLDGRHVEQAVHQAQHQAAGRADGRQVALVVPGKEVREVLQQKGAEPDGHAQWGAQVVRGHAQELILDLVQPLQLGVLFGQLALQVGQFVVQPRELVVRGCLGPLFEQRAHGVGLLVVNAHQLLIELGDLEVALGGHDQQLVLRDDAGKLERDQPAGGGDVELPAHRRAVGLQVDQQVEHLGHAGPIHKQAQRAAGRQRGAQRQVIAQDIQDGALAVAEQRQATPGRAAHRSLCAHWRSPSSS